VFFALRFKTPSKDPVTDTHSTVRDGLSLAPMPPEGIFNNMDAISTTRQEKSHVL
jgi:hypothetical protein